jgi:hypothetical protein
MDWSAWLKIIVGGGISGIVAVSAASRWLGDFWLGRLLEKEKAKYTREIEKLKAGCAQELEHYRAHLDRSIFVTRAHFETEFAALKEISQSLSKVKIAFIKLHPIEAGKELTGTERIQSIDSLERMTSEFHVKLEEWAVFMEPTMYDEFEHCYVGADAEWKRLKTNPAEHDRAGTADYFWKSYRQACQMVRDRIESLAVIPRT